MTGTEFQISVNAFLAAQLAALRASKFCPPPPVNIGGRQIIVDHLEFAANNIRHDVPATYTVYFQDHGVEQSDDAAGFDVELAQPVTVVLTDLQDVLSRPNQQPNLMLPISATVVLRFDYFAAGDGQCWLKVDCRLEHGPPPPAHGRRCEAARRTIRQACEGPVSQPRHTIRSSQNAASVVPRRKCRYECRRGLGTPCLARGAGWVWAVRRSRLVAILQGTC